MGEKRRCAEFIVREERDGKWVLQSCDSESVLSGPLGRSTGFLPGDG